MKKMSNRVAAGGRVKLFPSGVRPSAELQKRVWSILRTRSIDRFAVEIGTSSSLLAKIEAGMPCKADAIARVEALLDAREGGK